MPRPHTRPIKSDPLVVDPTKKKSVVFKALSGDCNGRPKLRTSGSEGGYQPGVKLLRMKAAWVQCSSLMKAGPSSLEPAGPGGGPVGPGQTLKVLPSGESRWAAGNDVLVNA